MKKIPPLQGLLLGMLAGAVAFVGCGKPTDESAKSAESNTTTSPPGNQNLTIPEMPDVSDPSPQSVQAIDPENRMGSEAFEAFQLAVRQGEDTDVYEKARQLCNAVGLQSAWEAIQALEQGTKLNHAVGGWISEAIDDDIELAGKAFSAHIEAMGDGWSEEKKRFAAFGSKITKEWMEEDYDAAESFAVSVEAGVGRVNAVSPLLRKFMLRAGYLLDTDKSRLVEEFREA